MKSYVLSPLDQLPDGEFGQKARRLCQLARWGYPICAGLALPASWFEDFCRHNALPADRPDEKAVLAGAFPPEMAGALEAGWQELASDEEELIVRSSASDEDNFEHSFAGLYESVGHVRDVKQLFEAVKTVWASSCRPEALAYASSQEKAASAMGVVIQTMLRCDQSGVLFTRDPLKGRRRILIEAVAGGNEEVTAGKGTCQRYTVGLDGGVDREAKQGEPVLQAGEITSLSLLARKVEASFGFPCDLEWGMRQGRIVLFQARPLRLLDPADAYHRGAAGLDCILLDRYAQPATVCYLSMLDDWQNRVQLHLCAQEGEEKPLCFLHNRVYWNVRYQREQYDAPVTDSVQKGELERQIRCGYRSWYRRIPRYEAQVRRLHKRLSQAQDLCGLLGLLDHAMANFCDGFGADHYLFLGIAQLLYRRLQRACTVHDLRRRADRWVGKYSSRNETIRANTKLIEIADKIKRSPSLLSLVLESSSEEVVRRLRRGEAPDLNRMLGRFLRAHGHRSVACDDLAAPHWSEAPEKVIDLLAQLLKGGDRPAAEHVGSHRERVRLARALACDELTKRQAGKLLTLTGEYMRLRENQRYYFDQSWVLLRRILLQMGLCFVEDGRLAQPEEIFHLTIREVRLAAEYPRQPIPPQLICDRRRLFEEENSATPPYIIKDSAQVEVQKGAGADSYKAMGISPGMARGRVRPIQSVDDLSRVSSGEIGVVRTFHPSWTPVLSVVSGLIMNYGNVLSHGAVVAREYGVPVVVFNGEAMHALCPGDEVELNGLTGRIRILRRADQTKKE